MMTFLRWPDYPNHISIRKKIKTKAAIAAGVKQGWGGANSDYRAQLTALLNDGNTVANYQWGVGLTGTTNASAWANQIGAAGPLLQATGANQPAIQADGSLLFNGSSQLMAGVFTLNQPTTLYLVLKEVTWASGGKMTDGAVSADTMLIQQFGSSPQLRLFAGAGSWVTPNSDLAVGAYGVVTAIFNGASSSIAVDSATAVTGNPGTANGGGITVGADKTGASNFANIQVKEIIARSVADGGGTKAQIQSLLKQIHGTP